MICDQAAEYVSALCDGEMIPPAAAQHIGSCRVCQSRLQDYLSLGVELRREASLRTEDVPARAWPIPQNRIAALWQKGWTTMRIPRLAFALLVIGVLALASSLAVVKVRAHADGKVVLLTVDVGSGKPIECALSSVDKKDTVCAYIGHAGAEILAVKIDLLQRSEDRVQLGVRMRRWSVVPNSSVAYSISDVDAQPQGLYWFEPGDTLKINAEGLAPITIRGNWLDRMPAFVGEQSMDPGPEELRIVSPVLIREKQVIGDLVGGAATEDRLDWAVWVYYPRQGSFLISNAPLRDAIKAKVTLNCIDFIADGQAYRILTGTPITRAQNVWVLHESGLPTHDGLNAKGENAFISSRALAETAPGVWIPKPLPD